MTINKNKQHIGRDKFVEMINYIIQLQNKEEKLSKALQNFADNNNFTGLHTQTPYFLVSWLESVMCKGDDSISWWLWDAPKEGKGSELDCSIFLEKDINSRYVIKTPEDLYDYLTGQLKPVNNSDEMTMNGFYCRKCKMIVKSTELHDYHRCKCGNFVDGGLECPRRGGNFEDMLDLNDEKTYTEINKEIYRLQEEENDK